MSQVPDGECACFSSIKLGPRDARLDKEGLDYSRFLEIAPMLTNQAGVIGQDAESLSHTLEVKMRELCDGYAHLNRLAMVAPLGIASAASSHACRIAGGRRSILDAISGWDAERHRAIIDELRDAKQDIDMRNEKNYEARARPTGRRRRTVTQASMCEAKARGAGRMSTEQLLHSVSLRTYRGGCHGEFSLAGRTRPATPIGAATKTRSAALSLKRQIVSASKVAAVKRRNNNSVAAVATPAESAARIDIVVKATRRAACDAEHVAGDVPRHACEHKRALQHNSPSPSDALCPWDVESNVNDTSSLYVVRVAQPENFGHDYPHSYSAIRNLNFTDEAASQVRGRICHVGDELSLAAPTMQGHSSFGALPLDHAQPLSRNVRLHSNYCGHPTQDPNRSILQHSHDLAIAGLAAEPVFIPEA
mmetsp:Transcript_20828/g.71999  ORF Transcript_20828/g.71999 Transcript_20828/m.71999 type:complete len:420 (+) Transcript_20828:179-1438(+)